MQNVLIKVRQSVLICSEDFLKKKAGILVGIHVSDDDSEYKSLENCLQFISKNRDMVSIFFHKTLSQLILFNHYYIILFGIYLYIQHPITASNKAWININMLADQIQASIINSQKTFDSFFQLKCSVVYLMLSYSKAMWNIWPIC